MKTAIVILLALMMVLTSCEQQTPANNDLLLGGSNGSAGYDPEYYIVTEDGGLKKSTNWYLYKDKTPFDFVAPEEASYIIAESFSGLPSLKTVKIGSNIERIEDRAFADSPMLYSVEMQEGVKTIGNGVFSGCTSLEYINAIPKSIESIGKDAFAGCRSLRLICYNGTVDSWYKLGADSYNADVPCYDGIYGKAVYRFSKNGENDYTLKGLTPYGKEQSEFTLPNIGITAIEDNTFKGVEATSINIPETVTSIGDYAFAESGITEVTIPAGVKSIGNLAFSTTAIKEVTIPANVEKLGYAAFSRCMEMETVTFAEGSKLETIDFNTFESCRSLTEITIPSSVNTIREWAFNGCSSLTKVTIPASVTKIGADAFGNCPSLTEIHVATDNQKTMLVKSGIAESIITMTE
ncbi:MAG: leucine-rich repeat protein [Bullifex sp.]